MWLNGKIVEQSLRDHIESMRTRATQRIEREREMHVEADRDVYTCPGPRHRIPAEIGAPMVMDLPSGVPQQLLGTRLFMDDSFYRAVHPSLGLTDQSQADDHFFLSGLREGLVSSPWFDVTYYRHRYGFHTCNQAFMHFKSQGICLGWRASAAFDPIYYYNANRDLRDYVYPHPQVEWYPRLFKHWHEHGIREGRPRAASFWPTYYLEHNPDVRDAFGATNYHGALCHYYAHGRHELRVHLAPANPE